MMRAYRSDLDIYIHTDQQFVRVDGISFPRFEGKFCSYETLIPEQRQRLDEYLKVAQEIVQRFIADGRETATEAEIRKAYSRMFS